MFKITPEYLTEFINFNTAIPEWHYRKDEAFNIPKIQAEGAAKLWNQLFDKKIGLLADEVGMGKTIQAIAVMTTLWQQKPNAKILLYAPNETVAWKWIREYDNFIRYNYRIADNVVKSAIKGLPLRKAVYCENHLDLMAHANTKWPSFYVCKTSSLSGFLSPKITEEALIFCGVDIRPYNPYKHEQPEMQAKYTSKWMYRFGKLCNDRLYSLLSEKTTQHPPFDLIIFDEAHYLRRSEGHSNRSIAAHAFFGGRDITSEAPWSAFKPVADSVLLLTATPNHSTPNDIVNIVSIFQPAYRHVKPLEILNNICVRRFRRLAGKTKHEYRYETGEGVEMESLSERLFFAAYHKALVKSKADANKQDGLNRKMDNPYRVLFGYLEGFEFLPQNTNTSPTNLKHVEGTDFTKREDTELIIYLSNKYKQAYAARPEHPKYRNIIERLKPNLSNNYSPQKKLIFVRRIASVYEISNRVIEDYDNVFYTFLQSAFSKKDAKRMLKNQRRFFWKLSKRDSDLYDTTNDEDIITANDQVDRISAIDSKTLSLFTKRKEGPYKSTDCFNFRNRFLNKEQIFSIFFEPGADYLKNKYLVKDILLNQLGKRQYKTTIQKIRNEAIKNNESNRLVLEQHFEISQLEFESDKIEEQTLETLLTIWLRYEIKNIIDFEFITNARQEYETYTLFEKEGFSRYLESGILFSSQFIVRFYALYRKIIRANESLRGEELYIAFCEGVREILEDTGLSRLIANAVLTFKIFYKKEVGATESNVFREKWSFLKNTLPVYPYSGDTKRESIIKAFNSPFYPDVIVSTSVLQEGVDLHYHCSEVIHYGIAWTQGDNEQRVGRVDRMFGKLENQLKKDPNAVLSIRYPFLKNTIDQDQVARFALRKHESEKLLDQLKTVHFGSELNLKLQIQEEEWQKCFNIPGNSKVENDPFPVIYEKEFGHFKLKYEKKDDTTKIKGYLNPLLNSIKNHFSEELVVFENENFHNDDESIFAIKHIRRNDTKRHQPIIGELYYSEQGLSFLGKPVYCIRISSPLASNSKNLDGIYYYELLKKVYRSNPLLKICLDKAQRGLYRYYVCADLPLFNLNNGEYNLSHDEIIAVIENVIEFTDELERIIHGANYDIKNEQIIEDKLIKWDVEETKFLSKDRQSKLTNGWRKADNGFYYLKSKISNNLVYDEIYQFNHDNHFVRKINDKSQTIAQTGIYKNDAIEEECLLLDNIIKFA